MKKLLVLILAIAMTLSLAACGGGEPAPATSSPAPASSASAPSAPASSEAPQYTEEQQKVAQEYLTMCEKYDEAVEKFNNTPALLEQQELVDTMNEVAKAIIECDEHFASPETLTPEVMTGIQEAIKATYAFIDEVNKLVANSSNESTEKTITVSVELINHTGADFAGLAMSPANDENWGENLLTEPLLDGESGVTEMTFTADTLVWDLLVQDAEGNQLTFAAIDFTSVSVEGAKLELGATEGGDYFAMFVK